MPGTCTYGVEVGGCFDRIEERVGLMRGSEEMGKKICQLRSLVYICGSIFSHNTIKFGELQKSVSFNIEWLIGEDGGTSQVLRAESFGFYENF
ncbi:hypothetical protein KJ693_12450 [bacterium]|nr:hypothetical protein [bacterium]